MKFTQIRNATVIIEYANKKFLIDPWLQDKGKGLTAPSPDKEKNKLPCPMVDLPCSVEEILNGIDACIVTHIHPDHFTEEYIPKNMLIIAQNKKDENKIKKMGFKNTGNLDDGHSIFGDINIIKTKGRHSEKKLVSLIMGKVCGLIFTHTLEKKLYIVGDSVWYEEIKNVIFKNSPEIIVLNACDARIKGLGRLIMNKEDVFSVYNTSPDSTLIISHMDTVNHGFVTRKEIKNYLSKKCNMDKILIPLDGESYYF